MAHDVFISYASKNAAIANETCSVLEEAGVRCWIAPRDLLPGSYYGKALIEAINGSRALVLIYSAQANESEHVLRELERAVSKRIPILAFRVEDVPLSPAMEYSISAVQWLDALTSPLEPHLRKLAESVRLLLKAECLEEKKDSSKVLSAALTQTSRDSSIEQALVRLGAKPYGVRREGLIGEAVELIRHGPLPVVLFQGLTGIGKRTLVCNVVSELREEFPLALVLDFDGPAALEPGYTLEEINDFLVSRGLGLDPARLQEQNQQKTLQLLIGQLRDMAVLVVLIAVDSLAGEWFALLLRNLAAAHVRAVATATTRPQDSLQAHVLSVAPLTDVETLAFIAEYARVFNLDVKGEELLQRIPAGIRSHPLALTTLLSHLRDVELELLLLEGIPDGARAPTKLVEQAITILSEPEREVLALLELLSEGDFMGAIKALSLSPPPELRSSLQTLLSRSLTYRAGTGYIVPAIVSEALAAVFPETGNKIAIVVSEALHRSTAQLDKDETNLAQIAATSARIVHRFSGQGRWELVRALTEVNYLELLNVRGYWKEYSLLLRLGIAAAKQVGDAGASFQLNCRLGRKLLQMSDVAGARAALAEAENYSGAESNTLGLAEIHSHRALLYTLDGRQAEALEELGESRRIRKALGDQKGLAMVDQLTGNVHLARREYQQALDAHLAALASLASEKVSKEFLDVQMNVALCERMIGRLEEAEKRLLSVVEQCKALRYDAGLPRALYGLALIAETRGHSIRALELARSAAHSARMTDHLVASEASMLANRLEMMATYRQRGKEK